MPTKNLGQVSGIWVGLTPPVNTAVIWYNSVPGVQAHFVWNNGSWIPLQPDLLGTTTYVELVGQVGSLPVGKFFKVTTRKDGTLLPAGSEYLALVITRQKIQYIDENNTMVVDDFVSNVTFFVTSTNLYIDDIVGVAQSGKIIFAFTNVPDSTDITSSTNRNDYFLLLRRISQPGFWKMRINRLLSIVLNNDISWNNGFFLNFQSKITQYATLITSTVSSSIWGQQMAGNSIDIANLQTQMADVPNLISNATSENQIYGKQLDSLAIPEDNSDIAVGDTLRGLIGKIQGWINSFKWATSSRLPFDWVPSTSGINVIAGDSVATAIAKIWYFIQNTSTVSVVLPTGWVADSAPRYTQIPQCAVGDDFPTVIAKLQGMINFLKILTDGRIERHSTATDNPRTVFDFIDGLISTLGDTYSMMLDRFGLNFENHVTQNSVAIQADYFQIWRRYFPNNITNPPTGTQSNFGFSIRDNAILRNDPTVKMQWDNFFTAAFNYLGLNITANGASPNLQYMSYTQPDATTPLNAVFNLNWQNSFWLMANKNGLQMNTFRDDANEMVVSIGKDETQSRTEIEFVDKSRFKMTKSGMECSILSTRFLQWILSSDGLLTFDTFWKEIGGLQQRYSIIETDTDGNTQLLINLLEQFKLWIDKDSLKVGIKSNISDFVSGEIFDEVCFSIDNADDSYTSIYPDLKVPHIKMGITGSIGDDPIDQTLETILNGWICNGNFGVRQTLSAYGTYFQQLSLANQTASWGSGTGASVPENFYLNLNNYLLIFFDGLATRADLETTTPLTLYLPLKPRRGYYFLTLSLRNGSDVAAGIAVRDMFLSTQGTETIKNTARGISSFDIIPRLTGQYLTTDTITLGYVMECNYILYYHSTSECWYIISKRSILSPLLPSNNV
jgi:hypothetical protein